MNGILCIHGFTGSPSEFSDFPKRFEAAGFKVSVPTLPGHCTAPEDLAKTTERDWIQGAETAYQALRAQVDHIFLLGFSMGSMVSMQLLNAHPEIRAYALMAAPYWINNKMMHAFLTVMDATGLWALFSKRMIAKKNFAETQKSLGGRFAYPVYPSSALRSLVKLVNATRNIMPKISQPGFLIHSRDDRVIPYESMAKIASLLPIKPKTMTLEGFGHVIACHAQRGPVFTDLLSFFKENSP